MKISNPFHTLLRGMRHHGTSLRRQRTTSDPIGQAAWEQNFQPFSEQSGMPTDSFPGKSRLVVFQLGLILVFGILLFRLVDLKVVRGEAFREQANTNFKRYSQVRASRGIIYDRNGVKLVSNEPDYVVLLAPTELRTEADIAALVDRLSNILEQPWESIDSTIRKAVDQNRQQVALKLPVSREQAITLMTDKDLVGIEIEVRAKRNYAAGDKLAHVLGYMTEIYDTEIEADAEAYYLPGDRIGRDGIERIYEDYLRGEKGIGEVEVDAAGRAINVRVDPEDYPKAGHNLTLTIDLGLQEVTAEALRLGMEEHQAKAAVAVVLDVRSGEILSLVSLPTYDNNLFSSYLTTEQFDALYSPDAGNPMFNRAVGGVYPPGSIFKPFVVSGALQEGLVTATTRLSTPGFLSVGGSTFVDWIWGQYGGSFGSLDAIGAIAKSSDVYMYQIGAGYEAQAGLGSEKIGYYANQFGIGTITGIDLPGEVSGNVPTKVTFEADGEPWYWGNTAHMAIGQGFTLVTPLQMVVATSAIANGGTLYTPHLLKEVQASEYAPAETPAPQVIRQLPVDAKHLQTVRQGMRNVILPGGTATGLANLPVPVAGKTGTAQHDKRKANHAWFTSFAPYDDPQIATVVLFEEGGEGSAAAAPATRRILEWYFTNRGN